MNKQELRKQILSNRESLTKDSVSENSKKINELVIDYIKKNSVSSIHIYLQIRNEVSTTDIINYCFANNITVIIPKTIGNRSLKHLVLKSFDDLVQGRFKTQYPKDEIEFNKSYDLIIVPAVGYDVNGNRIGYGAGYYDTFLEAHKTTYKIGLAHSVQIVENISAEDHDIPVNRVITN